MDKEDEIIEILDDFDDIAINMTLIKNDENTPSIGNIVNEDISFEPINSDLSGSFPKQINQNIEINNEFKNLEEVKYEPIKPEKGDIRIENDDIKEEDSKSGLGFIVLLFILLAIFIIALPYISQWF